MASVSHDVEMAAIVAARDEARRLGYGRLDDRVLFAYRDIMLPAHEKAVREQAAQELVAWADGDGSHLSGVGLTGPPATRRRTLHAAARKIAPKMTLQEVGEALARGDFAVCHLDEAGRAIVRNGGGESR